jgi:transcriptional regulator with XRE-family HTH domain
MNARELVAWNLRRLRVAKNFSQEHLANSAGVDRTYLSRLERKQENPSVGILEKVSEALGVHIADLFVPPEPGELEPAPLKAGRRPSR